MFAHGCAIACSVSVQGGARERAFAPGRGCTCKAEALHAHAACVAHPGQRAKGSACAQIALRCFANTELIALH